MHEYALYGLVRRAVLAAVELMTLLVVQPVGMCSCSRDNRRVVNAASQPQAMCSLLSLFRLK